MFVVLWFFLDMTSGVQWKLLGLFYVAPLAGRGGCACGLGEGASPQARTRGEPPSPRPSPRKGGEGAAGNRQKLLRLEAGAADQGAIHVGYRHQFLGVRRLHRAPVENADPLPGRWKPRREPLADEAVHLGHIGGCRGEPGADRPYGLVRDDKVLRSRAIRNRAFELRADHREGMAAGPVIAGLPDAQDGEEAGPPGSPGLAPHLGVGFVMERAALGMPPAHGPRARL